MFMHSLMVNWNSAIKGKQTKFLFEVVPYTSGKIWSAHLIFLIFLAVCLNISTEINIKILTNSNQQTQSYKFTSHITTFLSGFDHRDAWNLHTNIIWSKRSTDFKELSPCSVWYPLKWILNDVSWQFFIFVFLLTDFCYPV